MWKKARLYAGAALVMMIGTPLWFDGGVAVERAIALQLESLMLPTAAAAVIVPERPSTPSSSGRFDNARLLMGGTMLFGLAAVVRKASDKTTPR